MTESMSAPTSMTAQIRQVLAEYGRLPGEIDTIADGDDLYRAGLTSHASVNVMLGLEDAFDVEFPDELLRKNTFESIDAISAALRTLVEDAQINV